MDKDQLDDYETPSADEMSIPSSVQAEYEDAYDDLDDTAILLSILAELGAIRQAVTAPAGDTGEGTPETYRCTFCGDTVPEDERGGHLRHQHGAPAGVSLEEVFEAV